MYRLRQAKSSWILRHPRANAYGCWSMGFGEDSWSKPTEGPEISPFFNCSGAIFQKTPLMVIHMRLPYTTSGNTVVNQLCVLKIWRLRDCTSHLERRMLLPTARMCRR